MITQRRLLTPEEIEYVISDIKPVPSLKHGIAISIQETMVRNCVMQLKQQLVYPEIIEDMKCELTRMYYASQVQSGESVGIIAAQSAGEKMTQFTLNTFHFTGMTVLAVVTGVPRFSELLNATKNPRSVISRIYFRDAQPSIAQLRSTIGHQLRQVFLSDLVLGPVIYESPDPLPSWYAAYDMLFREGDVSYRTGAARISITCDPGSLFDFSIPISVVADAINAVYGDLHCVHSPTILNTLDIWVKTADIKLPPDITHIQESEIIPTYLRKVVVPTLYSMTVCGIEGITEIAYVKNTPSGDHPRVAC